MIYFQVSAGLLLIVLGFCAGPVFAANAAASTQPVTPGASAEAAALLQYIHSISGSKTLTGQHCNPLYGSIRLAATEKAIGKYPAVFGQDFGFSAAGTWDGINFRQQIVDEAIRRHSEGFIITLMWHAVRPIDDEPVTFQDSIQGKLTDEQWRELITPGTELHERWKSQVDVIAWHLRQLRDARVPVLWRPYHEMNGGWFWWGRKAGDDGYRKLYRMLFERLTKFHKLNNLIWVYNANELGGTNDPYETEYPGADVVDILATDVYRGGFAQRDYDGLLALANGKPIALGEVGSPPTEAILRAQPKWAWFMIWGEPASTSPYSPTTAATAPTTAPGGRRGSGGLRTLYESDRTLTWDELPWVQVKNPQVHHPVMR